MRIAAIDRVITSGKDGHLPVELRQSSARLIALTLLVLSATAIVALLTPAAMIVIGVADNPQTLSKVFAHPGSAALLMFGILVGLMLLAVPLRAGLARLRGQRVVVLTEDSVDVEDQGLFRRSSWTASPAQFCGVTHHIRATLSGARHEIILIHPDSDKDVLLSLTPSAPAMGAHEYARLLGLKEVHAKQLYARNRSASANDRAPERQREAA